MKKSIVILLVSVCLLGTAGLAMADTISFPNPLCLNPPPGACVPSPNCVCGFTDLIERITKYIFDIIGILAVLMFVVAGVFFVLSVGSPEKVKKAKDMAIYAVIGLSIALAGEGLIALLKVVIGAAT